MRVLTIVEDLPHEGKPYSWGFVAEQLRELSKYCEINVIITPVQACHVLKPIVSKQDGNGLPYFNWLDDIRYYRPRFPVIPRYPYRWYDYSKALAVMVCALRHRIRFDLIHAHYAYRSGYVAALIAKAFRKPMVLTVHGSDIHQQTRVDYQPSFWRDRTLKTLGMSTRIIAVSDSLKQHVAELGYGAKTTMKASGFVGQWFKPQDQLLCREKLGVPLHSQVLLYVGNMIRVKGLDLLPETVRLLCRTRDDILLLMLGRGALQVELKAIFAERGLMDKVRFVGTVPNAQVGEYMSAADVLVVPSRNEGRPAVVMEALSCGIPVVATKVGGIPETIVDRSLGVLVEPEDPVALAEAILESVSRDWDRKHLHEYAQQFSWENLAPQIVKIYEELLDRST